MQAKQENITTADGKRIAALVYEADKPKLFAVYTHMMPRTKESWEEIAIFFAGLGVTGIAIDLRGHGEADGGPDGFEEFTPKEHQSGIFDIEAAAGYLKEKYGAAEQNTVVFGASIGANLSLWYAKDHAACPAAILFSPGLDYKGILATPLASALHQGQKIYLVASHKDFAGGSDNAEQNKAIFDVIPPGVLKEITIHEDAGHGTDIVSNDAQVLGKIAAFIGV